MPYDISMCKAIHCIQRGGIGNNKLYSHGTIEEYIVDAFEDEALLYDPSLMKAMNVWMLVK